MYRTCLRCDGNLNRNSELPNLPIGRQIAFDARRGRVWVICERCQQWNLTPLERRLDALADCERVAATAESQVDAVGIGIARTIKGLTLLIATGVAKSDIANSRYGHRIARRQRNSRWITALFAALPVALGVGIWVEAGTLGAGLASAAVVGAWMHLMRRDTTRFMYRVPRAGVGPSIVWTSRLHGIRFQRDTDNLPVLIVPRGDGEERLRGIDAARFLAAFLPRLNDEDSGKKALQRALRRAASAERRFEETGRPRRSRGKRSRQHPPADDSARPWEIIARNTIPASIAQLPPETRLALEMAATEEVEQQQLAQHAAEAGAPWDEHEEIGAIADDLLVPDAIRSRVDELASKKKKRR